MLCDDHNAILHYLPLILLKKLFYHESTK